MLSQIFSALRYLPASNPNTWHSTSLKHLPIENWHNANNTAVSRAFLAMKIAFGENFQIIWCKDSLVLGVLFLEHLSKSVFSESL